MALNNCWHVTTAHGETYGAAAVDKGGAYSMVAARLTDEGSQDAPRSAVKVGTWDAPYGTVLHY